ncbi:MAG: DUF4474 domain-containing protein [Clostridiales bacterium]|nr:DUF4474 domain-containing protein [Clostridiales bacterium]
MKKAPQAKFPTPQSWPIAAAPPRAASYSGVWHARQDSIQQIGGYNDLYDKVFYYATSMDKDKFEFTSGGTDYVLWAWKGNYLNLGAGAELGIYSSKSGILGRVDVSSPSPDHWLADTGLSMPMTLLLKDAQGNTVFDYRPGGSSWWITGFNPFRQGMRASDLTATYTINFSGFKNLYDDFLKSKDYIENASRWSIDPNNKYILTLKF